MNKLGIITVGRSDFSILKQFIKSIQKQGIDFTIFASTAHFSDEFGYTANEIFNSFNEKYVCKINTDIEIDSSINLSKSISKHIKLFAEEFKKNNIRTLVLLGDRFETFAAATAATALMIDIIHLHGGVNTLGSMDNAFRNSISEMAKFHFVDNINARNRLIKKGFRKSRVFFLGSMGVESIMATVSISKEKFFMDVFESKESFPFAVATFHPSTKFKKDDSKIVLNIINAVTEKGMNILFTYPNSDINNTHIINSLIEEEKLNSLLTIKKNLGGNLYYSALRLSEFMIGNSSSGIIESSACGIPSINIGNRQEGRDRNLNTIDSGESKAEILKSIQKINGDSFTKKAFEQDIYFRKDSSEFLVNELIKIIKVGY